MSSKPPIGKVVTSSKDKDVQDIANQVNAILAALAAWLAANLP